MEHVTAMQDFEENGNYNETDTTEMNKLIGADAKVLSPVRLLSEASDFLDAQWLYIEMLLRQRSTRRSRAQQVP